MKTRTRMWFGALFFALLFLFAVVSGQQQPGAPQQPRVPPDGAYAPNVPNAPGTPNTPNAPNAPHPPPPDPLSDVMFPPDLIMGHARELKLTDEQKAFMRGEIQRTTTSFNELQWKLQDEMEALHDILNSSSVSEEQALAQLNKVLDTEREIKRLHIGLGVRLKNHLTPEQQEQLQRMRMPPQPPQAMPPRP